MSGVVTRPYVAVFVAVDPEGGGDNQGVVGGREGRGVALRVVWGRSHAPGSTLPGERHQRHPHYVVPPRFDYLLK